VEVVDEKLLGNKSTRKDTNVVADKLHNKETLSEHEDMHKSR